MVLMGRRRDGVATQRTRFSRTWSDMMRRIRGPYSVGPRSQISFLLVLGHVLQIGASKCNILCVSIFILQYNFLVLFFFLSF
jgi:hypothetical protein